MTESEFPKGNKDIFYCLYLACDHHMKKRAVFSKNNSKLYVEIVMKWGKVLVSFFSFICANVVGIILCKALETSCNCKRISLNDDKQVWNSYLIEKVSVTNHCNITNRGISST